MSEDNPGEAPTGFLAWIVDLVRSWGPAVLAVLLIRAFIFEPFRIPSGSMVPTLLIGDHVVVTKYSYGLWVHFPFPKRFGMKSFEIFDWGDPERGDIIVFRFPLDESTNYIKRVVGVGGDKVRVQNNKIFLNGVEQDRDYQDKFPFIDQSCRAIKTNRYVEDLGGVKHEVLTASGVGSALADMAELEVPPGHVFVMGDNRDYSEDSRRWKFVRHDQIKGKAHIVWLSWDGCAGGIGSIRVDRWFQNLYTLIEHPPYEG